MVEGLAFALGLLVKLAWMVVAGTVTILVSVVALLVLVAAASVRVKLF